MGLRINTNFTAVNAYRHLGRAQDGLNQSVERLSSGLRINHAQDDPAGLAISEKIRSQVNGLSRASQNAQDGVSLLQTAESALGEVQGMLQRIRELAIQAANGTLTSQDRVEIQREIDQLLDEVDRTSVATEFNTKKLLDGSGSALVSVDSERLTPIVMPDEVAEGNYRLEMDMNPGHAQVLKSDIFRVVKGEQYRLGTRGSAEDIWAESDFMAFRRQVAANDTDLYVRNASGQEWLIDTDNTAANATISPDGTKLAYTKVSGGVAQVFTYDMSLIGTSAASTQPVQISAVSAGNDASQPQWSADGRKLLFISSGDVYTIDPGTTTPSVGTLVTGSVPALAAGSQALWSASGSRILVKTATDLRILESDGSVVATFAGASAANYSWSSGGTKVVYDDSAGASPPDSANLWVFDLSSSTAARLTSVTGGTSATRAVFSKDGSKIAYVRDTNNTAGAGNTSFEIWTMNADGSSDAATAATAAAGANGATQSRLSWSTDGDWIYYLADTWTANAGTNYALARVRSDGTASSEQLLTGTFGATSALGEEDQMNYGRSGFWVADANQPGGADFTLWQDVDWSTSPDDARYPGSANMRQDFSTQFAPGQQTITSFRGQALATGLGANWTANTAVSFTVVGLDATGLEVGRSPAISVTTVNATDQVSLSWQAVSGATTYRVYFNPSGAAADRYYRATGTSVTINDPTITSPIFAGTLPNRPTTTPDRCGVIDYKTESRWNGFQLTRTGTLGSDPNTKAGPYVVLEVVGVRVTNQTAAYSVQGDRMIIDSSLLDGGVATQRVQLRATVYSRTGEALQQKTFEMTAGEWVTSSDVLDGAGFANLDGDYGRTVVKMGADGNTISVSDKVLLLYDAAAHYGGGTVWTSQNMTDTGSMDLDETGWSLRSGTRADRIGARANAPTLSQFLPGAELDQSIAWISQLDGNVHLGTGRVRYTAQATQFVASNLFETDLAERVTQLKWVDRFQRGISLLDTGAQTIQLYTGGQRASLVLQAGTTLEEVARKFRQVLTSSITSGGLGLGVDGDDSRNGVDGNSCVFVTDPVVGTDEALAGTLVLRSTVPGPEGRIWFSGDDRLIEGFSWAEAKEANVNMLDVTVYDAHTSRLIGRQQVNDAVLRGVIAGVDVKIQQNADVRVVWNADRRIFEYYSDFGKETAHLHVVDNPLSLQLGANPGQALDVRIGSITRKGMQLENLLVVSKPAAEEAIMKIDSAVTFVASQRARLGAYIGRLDSTINIIDITQENMQASESRIRDLDMAQQTVAFTRDQIMTQAATAMLAQANVLPQSVLQLLK